MKKEDKKDRFKVVCIENYSVSMSAKENVDGLWKFAVELWVDKQKLLYSIVGHKEYKTYNDAIMDCSGIIEYLGFFISSNDYQPVVLLNWDAQNETYISSTVYFNGEDFFQNNPKSNTTTKTK